MNTLETVRNRYFMLHLLYTTCQMQKLIGTAMGAHLKLTDSNVGGVLVPHLWSPEHIGACYLNSLGGDVFPCRLVCPGHSETALQLLLIEEQLWELQLEAQRVYILCRGFEIWLWLSL